MRPEPASLLLVRHGQSVASAEGRVAGLLDSPLTEVGEGQAADVGRLLADSGVSARAVFTSEMSRARMTAEIIYRSADVGKLHRDHRLNPRNYGAFTGIRRDEAPRQYGLALPPESRSALSLAPPPMGDELRHRLAHSAPFDALPATALTRTESMRHVIHRVRRFHHSQVLPFLRHGHSVVVVAHGTPLRALCAVVDELSDGEVQELELPPCQPVVYAFDQSGTALNRGGTYLNPSTEPEIAGTSTPEGQTNE